MPFKSASQRAFLFIHHPQMAKKWAREFPNQGKLPKHVKKSKKKGCININYRNNDFKSYTTEEWCFNLKYGRWKKIGSFVEK